MKEKEPFVDNLQATISELESSKNPNGKFMTKLLRELQSDAYKNVVIKGAYELSECGRVKALRIVAEQDGLIKNFIITDTSLGKNSERSMSRAIRDATKHISVRVEGNPDHVENLAINTLKHVSLQTIAAISIIENTVTGKDIVQIHFPTVFINFFPDVSISYKDFYALSLATHFLKKVPFK